MNQDSIDRVTRGAAWLDEIEPGWERKLDLSTLDINDPNQCVCGQVFMSKVSSKHLNGYGYAREFLTAGQSYDSGFVLLRDGDTWVELVKQRFDTGTLSDDKL